MKHFRRFMRGYIVFLMLTSMVLGSCARGQKEPVREENATALVAKRSAEIKLQSLGKQGDLIMVVAESFVTWEGDDGTLYYTVPAWVFVFRDPKEMTQTTSIEVRIQKREGLTINGKITDINFPKELSLISNPITGWKIDNDEAEDFARKEGGFPDRGTFMLKMRDVDGNFMPVWILPYRYEDSIIRGIRADNGEFVYLIREEEDKWTVSKPIY